jgi:hypothetical protein
LISYEKHLELYLKNYWRKCLNVQGYGVYQYQYSNSQKACYLGDPKASISEAERYPHLYHQ